MMLPEFINPWNHRFESIPIFVARAVLRSCDFLAELFWQRVLRSVLGNQTAFKPDRGTHDVWRGLSGTVGFAKGLEEAKRFGCYRDVGSIRHHASVGLCCRQDIWVHRANIDRHDHGGLCTRSDGFECPDVVGQR